MKWFFENGKEKALSELRRLLRPAKSIQGADLIQEIGSMIHESSNEDFIKNMAQRMVKNTLRRMGKKARLPDLPKLYEMKNIPPADCMDIRQIVQTIVNEVSWKRHRVYMDEITKEQILQYPSTMLLSDEIYGGCADKVVLLCTLLRALKFRLRFKLAVNERKRWSHIWAEVYLPIEQGSGEWVSIDPSKSGFLLGGKEEWERYWNENYISQGYSSSESAQTYEL
ncbi:MAG: Transglutaminase-like superfamily [Candidatus Poribacteria bacterium]|nr:Transglutaminase-like superfamily [Candidatus Poribacteria bacterium]